MKRAVHALSIVTAFSFASRAYAEVPSWCSALGQNRVDTSQDYDGTLKDDDPRNALMHIVGNLCKPDPEVTRRMPEFEAAREKWNKKLGMTEDDWKDVAQYATLGQGERMNGGVSINTNGQELGIGDTLKRAWSSFDNIDQYAMLQADAGASNDLALDHDYLADSFGPKLTETGRFSYIRRCLRHKGAVVWAMCQGDIDQLDLQKLASELRENKAYNGADKVRIRIEVSELPEHLAEHAAQVKKLIASDPGYAKVFETAAAVRKEWVGRYKTDAALLQLASDMDDARATNSRKAFTGCDEKTWAAWKTATAGVPAKKFTGMHNDRMKAINVVDQLDGPILSDPRAYLASIALTTCHTVGADRGAKKDILVRVLGDGLSRWPGYRGPRNAVETAVMAAGIELDDRDAKLDFPGVSRNFGGGGGSRSGGGDGVVAKLAPGGPLTTVTFKPQMVKQVQCAKVVYSHKITQIRPNGDVVYEGTCVKNETVTVDKSSGPQKVNPRYLTGVKPGMQVSITEDVLTAAWAKPGSAVPSIVFGVPVK